MDDPQALAHQLERSETGFLPYAKWMPRSDTLAIARRAIELTAAGVGGWEMRRGQDGVTITRVGPPPGGTISLPGRLVHRDPHRRNVFHALNGCDMVEDYPDAYIEAIDIPAVDLRPCRRCFG